MYLFVYFYERVGDAAQTIYGFRGAKSTFMKDLDKNPYINKRIIDRTLSTSYRFGKQVEGVANTILFAKANSPQKELFIPYRIRGGT